MGSSSGALSPEVSELGVDRWNGVRSGNPFPLLSHVGCSLTPRLPALLVLVVGDA